MGAAGLPFRATKDLDLVLSLEDEAAAFAVEMWQFIADGGYAVRERSARPCHYYRFARPTDPAFPAMFEIFARRPMASIWPISNALYPRSVTRPGQPVRHPPG